MHCIQQLTIRSRLMKCHEMSHDNTVSNFTETEHLIIHSFPKFLNSVKYCI